MLFCEECELGFLDPTPTRAELHSLYRNAAYFEGDDDAVGYSRYQAAERSHRRTFRSKLRLLQRIGEPKSLLEVGCGPGLLLDECARAGIAWSVGLDLNGAALERARQRSGARVVRGEVDCIAPGAAFDAVAMLDVLEHMTDPVALLENLRACLVPRGLLLLMTPNLNSWLARISGPRWVSFKFPEHVLYYTPESLRSVLRRAGFEVVALRSAYQYATLGLVLERASRVAPRLLGPLARAIDTLRLDEIVVPVPNGSLDVVARALPDDRPSS